ncbi:MAG: hypothetical protein HC819_14985 [Cyclobacteriaceae bacterium]|nr:hypothetical protein [Cyclobacteriaceae bacterium]
MKTQLHILLTLQAPGSALERTQIEITVPGEKGSFVAALPLLTRVCEYMDSQVAKKLPDQDAHIYEGHRPPISDHSKSYTNVADRPTSYPEAEYDLIDDMRHQY